MEFKENWQKASFQRPLPSLCFSGWSKKQYGRPGLWLAETYFDFSFEIAERNSAKLDRKQDLNVLYQVCVFWAEKWIKIATLSNPSKKVAHCTQVHVMGPFGPLVFGSIPKFFSRSLYSGERQWPFGPLVSTIPFIIIYLWTVKLQHDYCDEINMFKLTCETRKYFGRIS